MSSSGSDESSELSEEEVKTRKPKAKKLPSSAVETMLRKMNAENVSATLQKYTFAAATKAGLSTPHFVAFHKHGERAISTILASPNFEEMCKARADKQEYYRLHDDHCRFFYFKSFHKEVYQDRKLTPLMFAILHGRPEVVSALISKGKKSLDCLALTTHRGVTMEELAVLRKTQDKKDGQRVHKMVTDPDSVPAHEGGVEMEGGSANISSEEARLMALLKAEREKRLKAEQAKAKAEQERRKEEKRKKKEEKRRKEKEAREEKERLHREEMERTRKEAEERKKVQEERRKEEEKERKKKLREQEERDAEFARMLHLQETGEQLPVVSPEERRREAKEAENEEGSHEPSVFDNYLPATGEVGLHESQSGKAASKVDAKPMIGAESSAAPAALGWGALDGMAGEGKKPAKGPAVLVRGLVRKTALNGLHGTREHWSEEKGRFLIKFDRRGVEPIWVKPGNLMLLDPVLRAEEERQEKEKMEEDAGKADFEARVAKRAADKAEKENRQLVAQKAAAKAAAKQAREEAERKAAKAAEAKREKARLAKLEKERVAQEKNEQRAKRRKEKEEALLKKQEEERVEKERLKKEAERKTRPPPPVPNAVGWKAPSPPLLGPALDLVKGLAGLPPCVLLEKGKECLFLDDPIHMKKYSHLAMTQAPPVNGGKMRGGGAALVEEENCSDAVGAPPTPPCKRSRKTSGELFHEEAVRSMQQTVLAGRKQMEERAQRRKQEEEERLRALEDKEARLKEEKEVAKRLKDARRRGGEKIKAALRETGKAIFEEALEKFDPTAASANTAGPPLLPSQLAYSSAPTMAAPPATKGPKSKRAAPPPPPSSAPGPRLRPPSQPPPALPAPATTAPQPHSPSASPNKVNALLKESKKHSKNHSPKQAKPAAAAAAEHSAVFTSQLEEKRREEAEAEAEKEARKRRKSSSIPIFEAKLLGEEEVRKQRLKRAKKLAKEAMDAEQQHKLDVALVFYEESVRQFELASPSGKVEKELIQKRVQELTLKQQQLHSGSLPDSPFHSLTSFTPPSTLHDSSSSNFHSPSTATVGSALSLSSSSSSSSSSTIKARKPSFAQEAEQDPVHGSWVAPEQVVKAAFRQGKYISLETFQDCFLKQRLKPKYAKSNSKRRPMFRLVLKMHREKSHPYFVVAIANTLERLDGPWKYIEETLPSMYLIDRMKSNQDNYSEDASLWEVEAAKRTDWIVGHILDLYAAKIDRMHGFT